MSWQAEIRKALSEAVVDTSRPLTSLLPPRRSEESVVPIMESIANDRRGVYQVNIPNQGALVGIPDDVAVEVPAAVDGRGVHRIYGRRLPKRIMKYVMWPRMMRMEWALEAFLEGGRDLLFDWLIVDPRTKSNEQVEETIDAILKLPGNEEMARHFR